MNDAKELRDELSEVFQALKAGTINDKVASELNNTAGKMINSAKVQLDYKSRTKGKEGFKIDFLDCD